jgi:hypothetical protein
VSREELLTFEKFQQLEAEGVFSDERNQYLLSALCRLYIFYLSSKGGSADDLATWFGNPSMVQMRMPTQEDMQKIDERKIENEKRAYRGLIAIARAAQKKKEQAAKQPKEKNDVNGQRISPRITD